MDKMKCENCQKILKSPNASFDGKNCHKCYKQISNSIVLTKTQKEIITGLMLGDGCIQNSNRKGKGNVRITMNRVLTDKEYMFYLYEYIKNLCNSKPSEYEVFDKRTQKTYYSSILQSKALKCLMPLREKWYPEGIKIVPKDIELTPLVLLIWFLDDGTIANYKNKSNIIKIQLATNGFTYEEVCFLANLLSKRYNSNFIPTKNDNKYGIRSALRGTIMYLREISSIFPECMSRKSDKWKHIDIWNDKYIENDGKILKNIKLDYKISKYIIENNIVSFNLNDIANIYNMYVNSNGYIVPDHKIRNKITKYIKLGLIFVKNLGGIHGKNNKRTSNQYFLTENATEQFKLIYNKSKKELEEKYGIL